MLFNSYTFLLCFLPLTVFGWWMAPTQRTRLLFITLASYVFYGWWDYRFVGLMLASTTADFIAGRAIYNSKSDRRRKTVLIALLAFNLGILAFFKYFNFFLGTLSGLGRTFGVDVNLPMLHIVLPIGISFYTFNSISYTIDIYRRRLEPAKSVLEFSAFVAIFPHLVAGPIVRYSDIGEQFEHLPTRPNPAAWADGIWLFVLGLAKKVLVADVVSAALVTPLFAVKHAGFFTSWIAALAFTVQIYFDFSGYSDMAVGLALLFGLRFPQNFNSPYKSRNISEFWRRWHISLSTWLRDYLFIPLGGSRGSKSLVVRNLIITMFLGGLWHGAAWTFVVWGLYHGALLAGHAVCKQRGFVPRSRLVSVVVTFVSVVFGWVLFRAETLPRAGSMLLAMLGLNGIGSFVQIAAAGPVLLWMFAALGATFIAPNTWEMRLPRTRLAAFVTACLLVLCILQFASPSPFIYFQF